jgi:t-SNARE complex subunit (syntaxin)
LTTGLLGHASSSRRYKEEIKPMDDASEALFALKPVTFRYKKDIDKSQSLQYGLVAEDVAQVDPDLAIHDGKGQIESVHYNAINAMLLNEFLKEHRKVQEQETTIAELKKEIAALATAVREQANQIQKVSTELELSKPARRVAARNP